MSRIALVFTLAALLVVVGSCAGTRYVVDQDTRHDFAGYSSYAWFKLASPPDKAQPPTEASTILTRRVKRAIEGELAGRGMEKGPVEKADFLVTYSIVLQPRIVVTHMGWSMPYAGWGWPGWGWGAGWTGGRSSVGRYTEGTIVVDVLDRDNRSLVWRGIAEGAFSRPNPDEARIAKVIAKVMRDFPPM